MQNEKACLSYGFMFGLLLALSVHAAPLVSNIVGAQRAGTKLVDISYDLTDAENVTLSVTIRISKDAGATWDVPCTSLSGNGIGLEVTPGVGKSIVWDAGADWNGQWSDQMKVEITATPGAVLTSGEYLVVDLSAGPDAASYPVSTLTEVPAGGWTDEYKTTKLVLRCIPAGTFAMGSPSSELGRSSNTETQHEVMLSQHFYMGVFEVTQQQWRLVMGSNPSIGQYQGDTRPVDYVSYNDIRGTVLGAGWPSEGHEVDEFSFMAILRHKTGLVFDLPTEAQWEYACRAGTTTALNSGKNLTTGANCPNMAEVGRYYYNRNDGKGGYSGEHTKVGSYLPNAWGLYDMHGNVEEWCLDWYQSELGSSVQTDPVGASSGSRRVLRGGTWHREYLDGFAFVCRSASRHAGDPSHNNIGNYGYGFRVACLPTGL